VEHGVCRTLCSEIRRKRRRVRRQSGADQTFVFGGGQVPRSITDLIFRPGIRTRAKPSGKPGVGKSSDRYASAREISICGDARRWPGGVLALKPGRIGNGYTPFAISRLRASTSRRVPGTERRNVDRPYVFQADFIR
jgi:hypothetical protein